MARGHGWLTPEQVDVLITIERIGAGCSMVAITLTILSYWLISKFRTTPNLFLLFASIANAGASVASMMGYDGLDKGEDSTLCQAQAFIFQWFMQSDPWWSLAMAINVFLVFFCNASPSSFRKYAWVYLTICFGGPLVTAISLIVVRHKDKGLIFGDAALWCWISQEWSLVRLWSYYIPVWFCILLSFIIYVAVGYHVFHTRNQLRNAAADHWNKEETSGSSPSGSRDSSEESLNRRTEFYGTVITEVQVTTDFSRQRCHSGPTIPTNIQIRGSPHRTRSWALALDGDVYEANGENKHQRFETVCTSDRVRPPPSTVMTRLRAVKSNATLKLKRLDPVKMAYLRTSFIFAFAVLITWIPSSINRLYSLSHDGKISFQLSVASGCVLPLQGVWNAVIYFTTSWATVRETFKSVKAKLFKKNGGRSIRLESRLGTTRSQRHDIAAQLEEPCTTKDDCENGYDNRGDSESWDCANSV